MAESLAASSPPELFERPDLQTLRLVFVGERRSRKAIEIGGCWENGRLAAKTLHDALRAAGLHPESQTFLNLFPDDGPSPSESVLLRLREFHGQGVTIVGMGQVVQRALTRVEIPHVPMVHPAARGRIRARALYYAHVARVLGSLYSPVDNPGLNAGNPRRFTPSVL
ncbi:MAG: hypothetical protein JRN08_07980 [Nitrososphaerota archaeon]|nr:hypothetical protein [Nitrososphaerota archaeon]